MTASRMLALACVALAACAPKRVLEQVPTAELQQSVTIEASEFQPSAVYSGIKVDGGDGATFFLRSFVPRDGGAVRHQLYVSRLYDRIGWVFYAKAADDDANPHEVVKIASDVLTCGGVPRSCLYSERFGVGLTDEFLRARADRGFKMQVSARNGEGAIVLAVPPNYIQAQLAALPQ